MKVDSISFRYHTIGLQYIEELVDILVNIFSNL